MARKIIWRVVLVVLVTLLLLAMMAKARSLISMLFIAAFFGVDEGKGKSSRLDLANFKIQRYVDTAIASYTLLVSTADAAGVKVAAHNESRVMVKLNGTWKVVHVHKSPAWQAPHIPG